METITPDTNSGEKKTTNAVVNEQLGDKYKIEKPDYTPQELLFRSQIIYELQLARDQRDRYHPELDNMTYVEYYESNRRKDLSYIPSKKNKDDVRIVTGTTREKDTTLLNSLLGMNLKPQITAFDDDDLMVNELGDNMGDMVQKSRELEDYDKKRSIIYREMISQGDVFVQELYKEDFREVPTSELHWDPTKDGISDFSIKKRLQKIYEGPEVRMVNGKKVYLGNIRCPFIEDQQLVAVLNVYPRAQAEARYGQWERWKHVPYGLDTMTTFYDDGATYKDWNLVTLNDKDKVAEIMVYWKERNIFMILLNGVLMLPIDFPLTAISPTGEIPMAQGKLEPISDFAYSKSQPSKTKVKQELLDEITKLMIQKNRQSYRPPLGNRGKKVYSSNIFTAGRITTDISEGELFPILGPNFNMGITQPDFQFYKTIKESIDEETTTPQQGGEPADPNATAAAVQEQKQAEMVQLGLSLDGVINLERRMTWNRIYNIITHWTKEQDEHIDDVKQGIYDGYKSFAVSTTLDNGQKGTRIFRQTTDMYPAADDHEAEEEKMTKEKGHPVRITYLNPKMLSTVPFKWFIQIIPSHKSNDKLSQAMFIQNLQQAIAIFGPDSINQEYAKQRYAIIINEDYTKFFKKMSVMDMLNQQNGGQQGQDGQQQPGAGAPVKAPAGALGKSVKPNMGRPMPMMPSLPTR